MKKSGLASSIVSAVFGVLAIVALAMLPMLGNPNAIAIKYGLGIFTTVPASFKQLIAFSSTPEGYAVPLVYQILRAIILAAAVAFLVLWIIHLVMVIKHKAKKAIANDVLFFIFGLIGVLALLGTFMWHGMYEGQTPDPDS